MENAAFVLIAVGVAALASLLLWLAHRRPRTFMSSIEDFQREMKALGHEGDEAPIQRWQSRRARGADRREQPSSKD
jgi:hypothetical protein